jgi:hypothetical protein
MVANKSCYLIINKILSSKILKILLKIKVQGKLFQFMDLKEFLVTIIKAKILLPQINLFFKMMKVSQ